MRSARAVSGGWGVVFTIDAPWRLDPQPGGTYGKIPVVVTFRQAYNELGREYGPTMRTLTGAGSDIWVGDLTEVRVVEWVADQPRERQPATTIVPSQFREIELKREMSTKAREPDHRICRPYAEPCPGFLSITATDEWHGMFWYTPKTPVTPGRNVHLEVTVVTASNRGSDRKEWTASLVVHAGEAQLPRFSSSWLYGDLHYHSQMTGNEGEYGHSYRNVARALGAMGMDFVFTTDHASNGEQTLSEVEFGHCGAPDAKTCTNWFPPPHSIDPKAAVKCDDGTTCTLFSAVAARDLNASRFAMAKQLIYGAGGADDAVARDAEFGFGRLRSANVLPQIYMGEEVDAQPEMSSKEYQDGVIHFGDGSSYPWPDVNHCLRFEHGLHVGPSCRDTFSKQVSPHDHRSYIVYDQEGFGAEEHAVSVVGGATHVDQLGVASGAIVSGLLKAAPSLKSQLESIPAPARQHIVYFPSDGTPGPAGWVPSDTTKFGGGGRRLQAVVGDIGSKGFAFLAHPLIGSSPGGMGPDVVPYSDYELDQAWASPSILGLEFWNEQFNRSAIPTQTTPNLIDDADHRRFRLNAPYRMRSSANFPWQWPHQVEMWVDQRLYEGAFTWDRYLRKGLDPAFTAGLTWLPKGEPRKWFMAGGSDAHGDLNYRQLGEMCQSRWCVSGVIDTAVGRPRNLVMVSSAPGGSAPPDLPSAKRYTNRQVIDGLRSGQFTVTNGPAVRIVVDRNRNGTIDEGDFMMGSTFEFYPGEHIPLLVEWLSTKEFGPVARVDVYVGNSRVTFAPEGHGPFELIPLGDGYGHYAHDPSGALAIKLTDADGRYNKAGGVTDARYHGIAQINLGPGQFALASADQALFYVRALAKTVSAAKAGNIGDCPSVLLAGTSCGDGLAYSNPIWGRFKATCPAIAPWSPGHVSLTPHPFLDADNDGRPDICERDVPDPCPGGPLAGQPVDRPHSPDGSSTPGASGPQKLVPSHSCQMVRSLIRRPVPGGHVQPGVLSPD